MILTPSQISSDSFSFKDNTFSAEISDFGPNFRFGRVYDDACDEGFTIVSSRTGKAAVFALNRILGTEDLEGWDFVCVTPGLKNLRAVIFND
jgi:hypothetical protein